MLNKLNTKTVAIIYPIMVFVYQACPGITNTDSYFSRNSVYAMIPDCSVKAVNGL